MECLQNRVDSFAKSVRVPNPNKKNTFKNLKWPHPTSFLANPTTLAEAGFYYHPSYEDRDSVTCFVCEKQLSDWEAEDDPFNIHWSKCGDTCYWASLRCGLRDDLDARGRFIFADKSRLPSSKPMEKLRLQSFSVGDGWIHDKTRNHGAGSKKMAKAGFVFTPQHAEDDLATCLYCGISLSSWDSGDDPLEEHRKRKGDTCPFFAPSSETNPKSRSASSSKPSSRTSSATVGRSLTRSQSRAGMPGSLVEGEEGEEEPPSSTYTVTTTTKGRPTTTRKASRARKTVAPIEEEDVPVQQSSQTEPSTRSRKSEKPRSLSRSTNRKPTVTRSRKTIAAVEEEEEPSQEEPVLEEVPPKKPTASRKASRTRKTGAAAPPPVEEDTDADEAEEPEPAKPSRKRKPRSKSVARKTQQVAAQVPSPPSKPAELEEMDEEMEDLVLPKKIKNHQTTAPFPGDEAEDDEGMQERVVSEGRVDGEHTEIDEDEIETVVLKKDRKERKVKPKQAEKPHEEAAEELIVPKKKGKSRVKSSYVVDSGNEVQEASRTLETSQRVQVDDDQMMEESIISKRGNETRTTTRVKGTAERTDIEEHTEFKLTKKTVKGMHENRRQAEDEKEEAKMQVEANVPTSGSIKVNQKQKPTQDASQDVETSKARRPTPTDPSDVESEKDEEEVASMALDSKHPDVGTVPVSPIAAKLRSPSLSPIEVEPKTPIRPKQHPLRFPDPAAAVQSADIDTPQRGNGTPDFSTKQPSTDKVPSSSTSSSATAVNQLQSEPKESSSELGFRSEPPKAMPEFIPFLSKLPFTPFHALSEAELDMTVEEWIRYQIDVEYDKFKRDGERELMRFRKRAEEVRRVIEGL